MSKALSEFTDLLRTLEAQAGFLTATSVYCIGRCSCKTDQYPVTYLMDLAKRLGELAVNGTITEANRTVAEYLLSEGKVDLVVDMLAGPVGVGTKRRRDAESRMSSLDNFTQRIEINGQTYMKNPETQQITTVIDPTLILPEPSQQGKPPPVAALDCAICMEVIPEQDFLPLEKCGCIFHQTCVLNYLTDCIEKRNYPIMCPQVRCKAEVHPLDLKERLSAKLFQQFEQGQFDVFLMRNGKDFQNCPTPGCNFVFNWTKENSRFKCPICAKVYCLLCKKEFHEGITCQEYKTLTDPKDLDNAFNRVAERGGFMLCPNCQAMVEKVDGCDHISCVCGTDFCYHCGFLLENCECGDGNTSQSEDSYVSQEAFVCPNCLQEACQCLIPVCRNCLRRIDVCQCY